MRTLSSPRTSSAPVLRTWPALRRPAMASAAAPPAAPPGTSRAPGWAWAACAGLLLCSAAVLSPTRALAQTQTQTQTAAAGPVCPAMLNHTVQRLQDEKPQQLCQYAGKVLLVVNTASYCGFTGQFQGLEALNARYAARGLVVMGFPSNDFKQEDADAKKTADVCFNTHGVKFPMFATGPVRGADAQALFKQLTAATGKAPSWNFNKYLVGRDGRALAHFGSTTSPDSATVVQAVEKALAARP